jgi:hypothetical protein
MARERIEMSIQNDILNYKNQGKKTAPDCSPSRSQSGNSCTLLECPPEEVAQELEWAALLNWDQITDQVEHGGT